MVFVCPILYLGWKIVWKTKMVKASEADLVCFPPVLPLPSPSPSHPATHCAQLIPLKQKNLQVWERPIIDAYEANTLEPHLGFWEEVKIMMGFERKGAESESEL
jgi:amino acid transporter